MKKEKGSILNELLIILIIISIIVLILIVVYIYLNNNQIDVSQTVINFVMYDENTTNNQNKEVIQNTNTYIAVNNTNTNENISDYETDTTKYYYNQLDSTGKTIYNELQKHKEDLKTGTYKIDFNRQFNELLHESDGEEKLGIAYQSAWNAFSYDNVDLFYLDISKISMITESRTLAGVTTYYVTIGSSDNSSYLSSDFSSKEEVETAENYMQEIRNQVNTALTQYSNEEKIKQINNWMIDNLTYEENENNNNKYNIYGAMKGGRAVCEGYARMFKYIMDGINIPCVLVSGTATDSDGNQESHAWNYVQLNGNWYAVDVTWNDPIIIGGGTLTNEERTKYLLKGKSFLEDHMENGVISENSITFTFPELVND